MSGNRYIKIVWTVLPLLSLLMEGCAISELRPEKKEEVKAPVPLPDLPSRMVFVERDNSVSRNSDGTISKTPVVHTPTSVQEEIAQLMRYSRIMHSYPKTKIKDEFKRLASEIADDPSVASRIQMAILLSIPKTSFINEKRAAHLLTEIVNDVNQPSSALQEYAYLLLETLQQRNEQQILQNELLEELQKERQKRSQLQEQLNALKSIEKSISQRQHNTEATTEADNQ